MLLEPWHKTTWQCRWSTCDHLWSWCICPPNFVKISSSNEDIFTSKFNMTATTILNFYRTMRRIARTAVARCLSVCLASRYCAQTTKHKLSSNFFHLRVPHHSSFSMPTGMAIFRRGNPHRGVECNYFLPIYRFISETIHDRATITMECE